MDCTLLLIASERVVTGNTDGLAKIVKEIVELKFNPQLMKIVVFGVICMMMVS